jgi:dTDP-4-dehydrorhamnose reductase
MRILLTGCEGQLGRALSRVLPAVGELQAFARAQFDLASPESMRAVLDRVQPALIVNAAAYTAVDRAEVDRDAAMTVNGAGPGFIAGWAAAHGAAVLHYSTDYVFAGGGTAPHRETDATAPVNAYGETKLMGELIIRQSGVPHLIVRTSWLYAAEGRNFVSAIRRLAAEREELRIVDDQIGAPTPAGWLADVTARILRRSAGGSLFEGEGGGILHAAPAGETSWYGFACAIVEDARWRGLPVRAQRVVPIASDEYPTPARRPRNSRLALDRLRGEFGIEPPDWRAAFADEMG